MGNLAFWKLLPVLSAAITSANGAETSRYEPDARERAELARITTAFGKLDQRTDTALDCEARDALSATVLPMISIPRTQCPEAEAALAKLRALDAELGSACAHLREELRRFAKNPPLCPDYPERLPPEIRRARDTLDEARRAINELYPDDYQSFEIPPPSPCAYPTMLVFQVSRRAAAISMKLYGKIDYTLDQLCENPKEASRYLKEVLQPSPP